MTEMNNSVYDNDKEKDFEQPEVEFIDILPKM